MSIIGELTGILSEGWVSGAVCSSTDPEIFHPAKGESGNRAKAICHTCPVRQECLDHAMKHREAGVWGGLSEGEREKLRRGQNPYVARRRPAGHPESCYCPNCNRARRTA